MIKSYLTFAFLFFFQAINGQSDSLMKHNIYIGFNVLRMTVGDIEMQVMYRISQKFTIGVSGGYDFNFLDYKESTTDSTHRSGSIEGESNETSRYLYGNGAAFRFNIDYNFVSPKKKLERFISIEALIKQRNYENYHFNRYPFVIVESGEQKIYGLTFYYGTHYSLNKIMILRLHWGIGVRYLNSDIHRPAFIYEGQQWPETNFNYKWAFPSLHFGLTLIPKL